jgi:methyl-coenzyme M reductase subunit D
MDIEIFPHRLLSADTTEKVLKEFEKINGVKRIVLQGQRLSPEEMNDPDRKTITINGEDIDLQVKTGRILMEVENEETIENIRAICSNYFHFGFDINMGTFIRKQKTVTDKLKYGENLDQIPKEMVGLTDQNAKLSERTNLIKK